jgi:cyclopropane fatty-acyl-phospholipid synthase-like methyltransferase
MKLMSDFRQFLLGMPFVYRLFQGVVGRKRGLERVVELLAIEPGAKVLDIGCGPADILEYLPADVAYHGFDVSENYIAAARARFGDRGTFSVYSVPPDPTALLGQFDVVIAIGVLHHLDDAEADALFAMACKTLRPGGRVFTIDGTYVPDQYPIARILLKLDRGKHVRSPEAYLVIARRNFPNAAARVFSNLIRIPYTHCIIDAVNGPP